MLRTIEPDRFVTGVTWIDGEVWHGTWRDETSEPVSRDLNRIGATDFSVAAEAVER